MIRACCLIFCPLLLAGCVVRTAAHVATLPVRATGWTYDRLTVSQAEADRARGRRDRKAEEKAVKAARQPRKAVRAAASPPPS